ncbi:PREDICTED: protein lethal(2)essential for life-like [Polistes dominula]|uniref:Protein lethal(2)essential for life-like n=1 Tax=Polistes dominula TaxID=743375 RepID=A0ABM1IE42_POLDO|nr:PREDICTED: protein lethal(2)essential for life-like [Polistes dominula]
MSLIPLIFSNWWEDLERPHRLFDQNFGVGLYPDQLLDPTVQEEFLRMPTLERRMKPLFYYRPWAELLRRGSNVNEGTSTVKADKDKFQVVLDVKQFKPDEINVKVTDKYVVVEAKHEEQKDEHGWISRQFTRKYMIPEQCDIDQVSSSLSSDGVLSITAPRKEKMIKEKNERKIKIEQTGKPAILEKQAEKKEEKEEPKKEEPKKEESKKEEPKKVESKKMEPKKEECKKEECKKEECKRDECKKEESKKEKK